jgi:predicted PurR-regulated permease PerM
MSVKEAPGWLRDHSSRIVTTAIVMALLYLGRSVLIPLALAIMLSLLVAPLVRTLRRLRLDRTSSVLVAVAASTIMPLTLCLLVAGRHLKGLGVLELLLGNRQPLTLPQRFYQRALSADPHEIIANARVFLKMIRSRRTAIA